MKFYLIRSFNLIKQKELLFNSFAQMRMECRYSGRMNFEPEILQGKSLINEINNLLESYKRNNQILQYNVINCNLSYEKTYK